MVIVALNVEKLLENVRLVKTIPSLGDLINRERAVTDRPYRRLSDQPPRRQDGAFLLLVQSRVGTQQISVREYSITSGSS